MLIEFDDGFPDVFSTFLGFEYKLLRFCCSEDVLSSQTLLVSVYESVYGVFEILCTGFEDLLLDELPKADMIDEGLTKSQKNWKLNKRLD